MQRLVMMKSNKRSGPDTVATGSSHWSLPVHEPPSSLEVITIFDTTRIVTGTHRIDWLSEQSSAAKQRTQLNDAEQIMGHGTRITSKCIFFQTQPMEISWRFMEHSCRAHILAANNDLDQLSHHIHSSTCVQSCSASRLNQTPTRPQSSGTRLGHSRAASVCSRSSHCSIDPEAEHQSWT